MEGFRISRIRRGAYFDMRQSHMHAAFELYYLLDGERKMFLDDTFYPLGAGDLVFIPMNTIHKTTHMGGRTHERIAVTFAPEVVRGLTPSVPLERALAGDPVTRLSGESRAYAEGLLCRMLEEDARQDGLSPVAIISCLQELLVFLARRRSGGGQEAQRDIDTADRQMQEAARFIRANYMNDIDLNAVAGSVRLSPCYFSKKFKASTGFGYREYLLLVRVREACALLTMTNKTVTEVALSCGFSDSNYFGDVFRREKGMSPLQYRKSRRAADGR